MIVKPPSINQLHQILPDEPLLMMGAGPVPIPEAVSAANGIVINHLGSTMAKVVEQVKSMAGYIFQTQSPWILGVAGPGSAAMEMAVVNLIWPGTRVLNICNGFFSARLAEMSLRTSAECERLYVPDGQSVDPDAVREVMARFKPQVVTMVQGETSNTTFNRQLPEVAKIAREHDCLVIVDAVCTLSTMALPMDEWGVDAVITGGQKGLSSIPGVSLIAFSEKAWARVQNRKAPMSHWTLDANLATNFWHKASYHYTAPVSGLLALHEAMRLVIDETLEKRFHRHEVCSKALQAGIETMGLELFVEPDSRLNSVIGIRLPAQLTSSQICAHISAHYRVEIAGSFGPPIVRIGQMGEQCRTHNLFRALHAFGSTFKDLGVAVDVPGAMAELENQLQKSRNV
ncbi:pyridoxal-phosphate-dependent aminotransferase family protein [Sessilibacter sp. MAH2]